jgi:FkbM family methyltransferase
MTALSNLLLRVNARLRMVIGRKFPLLTRTIDVRGQPLRGPVNHQLDFYTRNYFFYDYFLPLLCKVVSDAEPDGDIVDIGANIGDTAVMIRQRGVKNRIVAVEASPIFFGMLERNVQSARQLFGDIRLVKAFVGSSEQNLVLKYTDGTAGTRIADAVADGAAVPTVSMDDLKLEHVSLVKVDTDGYDGAILEGNLHYFIARKPVIWAETYVTTERDLEAWRNSLDGLVGSYQCFYLFDNTGLPALAGELTASSAAVIAQLIRSAWVARMLSEKGLGACGVAYYDIALVPEMKSRVWRDFQSVVSAAVLHEAGVAPVMHLPESP